MFCKHSNRHDELEEIIAVLGLDELSNDDKLIFLELENYVIILLNHSFQHHNILVLMLVCVILRCIG